MRAHTHTHTLPHTHMHTHMCTHTPHTHTPHTHTPHTHTLEYYSAIKKNEIMPFAETWVDLGYFPGGSVVKNPLAETGDAGDEGSIPGFGGPPEEGNGNPLQYSCLGNPMDRGSWWSTVHGIAKSQP